MLYVCVCVCVRVRACVCVGVGVCHASQGYCGGIRPGKGLPGRAGPEARVPGYLGNASHHADVYAHKGRVHGLWAAVLA